jgi:PPOX class probable F420-dependent enzyme
MTAMTATQRDAFLKQPRIAKLVTLYTDGSPTVVPIWYEWDGKRARVFTARDSAKIRRIRADPRVCLSVEEPAGVPEAWVTIEGTATIQEQGGFELAQRLAPRYYPPEQSQRALSEWGERPEQWVVVEIIPRRIRSMAPS